MGRVHDISLKLQHLAPEKYVLKVDEIRINKETMEMLASPSRGPGADDP
jgi:hypothetical protein